MRDGRAGRAAPTRPWTQPYITRGWQLNAQYGHVLSTPNVHAVRLKLNGCMLTVLSGSWRWELGSDVRANGERAKALA